MTETIGQITSRPDALTVAEAFLPQNGRAAPTPIDLVARLGYWQRQLRLQDWELTVEFANAREVEGHCALSSVNEACQEARIRILDEAEWPIPSDRVGIWHLEYFLIHELVHLHVMAWKGPAASDHDSLEYQQKERAIDLMAGALWRLERGERR